MPTPFTLQNRRRFAGLLLMAFALHLALLVQYNIFSVDKKPKPTRSALVQINLQPTQAPASPRRRTISSNSTDTEELSYLERWQSYVERYGNTHYPPEALKKNTQGDLTLRVCVNKDGTLHDVTVLQSSGTPLLDQAAIQIVNNAAPFEPLPLALSEDIEILEIVRTWQFRGDLSTTV